METPWHAGLEAEIAELDPALLQAVTEIHNRVTKFLHAQNIIKSLREYASHILHNNQNYYSYLNKHRVLRGISYSRPNIYENYRLKKGDAV